MQSDANKWINEHWNKNEKGERNIHGKKENSATKLDSNSETEIDPSDTGDTIHLNKSHTFADDMVSFDKKIVQSIQNLHFHTQVLHSKFWC